MVGVILELAILLFLFGIALWQTASFLEEAIEHARLRRAIRRAIRKGSALTLRRARTVIRSEAATSASAGPSGHQPTSVQGESTHGR
jgi:hypothetical protein